MKALSWVANVMKFVHSLARAGRVWPLTSADGNVQPTLVVVTTLALDPESKRYKTNMVERLSAAAREYLSEHPDKASGFVLINRLKDWTPKAS